MLADHDRRAPGPAAVGSADEVGDGIEDGEDDLAVQVVFADLGDGFDAFVAVAEGEDFAFGNVPAGVLGGEFADGVVNVGLLLLRSGGGDEKWRLAHAGVMRELAAASKPEVVGGVQCSRTYLKITIPTTALVIT